MRCRYSAMFECDHHVAAAFFSCVREQRYIAGRDEQNTNILRNILVPSYIIKV